MPTYFFDLSDGSRERDTVGTELPDDDAAKVEAIRFLGEVLRFEPGRLAGGELRVDVRTDRDPRRFQIETRIKELAKG